MYFFYVRLITLELDLLNLLKKVSIDNVGENILSQIETILNKKSSVLQGYNEECNNNVGVKIERDVILKLLFKYYLVLEKFTQKELYQKRKYLATELLDTSSFYRLPF